MVLGILKTIIFIFPEPENKNIIDYHQNIDCEKFQQQQKKRLLVINIPFSKFEIIKQNC